MAKVLATVSGTALTPGVSKNRRLYTRDMIAGAVKKAQEQIAAGDMALTTLTHHAAGDDSTRIVGRVTSMSLAEDGSARFTADLADTPHSRTIAALADSSGGEPFLKGVSIRGHWLGKVRRVKGPSGEDAESGEALELAGLDFTKAPGVDGAQIDAFAWARGGQDETSERVPITESVEAVVTFSEDTGGSCQDLGHDCCRAAAGAVEALALLTPDRPHVMADGRCVTCETAEATAPMGKRGTGLSGAGRVWADPGYQADKKQRYDLSTKANAKAAWSYIGQKVNAGKYTTAQLARVKGRIVRALKKFGVTPAAEGWCVDPAARLTEAVTEGDAVSSAGSWSIRASNGPIELIMSSWCMDPADLDVILRAAADAACAALAALDPDMDGDVDVPAARPGSDTDDDAGDESAPPAPAGAEPDPAPAGHPHETEDPAMGETSTAAESVPATETAPPPAAPAIDYGQLAQAIVREQAAAAQPAPPAAAPPAAPAVEAAPAETEAQMIERVVAERVAALVPAETAEQRIARLVDEQVSAARQQMVASGQVTVQRAGLTAGKPVGEAAAPGDGGLNSHGLPEGWPDKPAHEYTSDERDRFFGPALVSHVLGARADLIT